MSQILERLSSKNPFKKHLPAVTHRFENGRLVSVEDGTLLTNADFNNQPTNTVGQSTPEEGPTTRPNEDEAEPPIDPSTITAEHERFDPNRQIPLRRDLLDLARVTGIALAIPAVFFGAIELWSKTSSASVAPGSPTPRPARATETAKPTYVPTPRPTSVPPSPTAPPPTATTRPIETPIADKELEKIKSLITEMIKTTTTNGESEIFVRAENPQQRKQVLPFMAHRESREKALKQVWEDRKNENLLRRGLALNPDIEKLGVEITTAAKNFGWPTPLQKGISPLIMTTAVEALEEVAKLGADSRESKYRQIPDRNKQVPALFLAAIAQCETEGGVNFGTSSYKSVMTGDQYDTFAAYFKSVKPLGLTIELPLNAFYASSGGHVGIPQVEAGTLKNIQKKEDGSNLNIYDLFEGTLAISYILVAKGWDNSNKEKSRDAFTNYCGNSYSGVFDTLWDYGQNPKYSQLLKNESLFIKRS